MVHFRLLQVLINLDDSNEHFGDRVTHLLP